MEAHLVLFVTVAVSASGADVRIGGQITVELQLLLALAYDSSFVFVTQDARFCVYRKT